MKMNWYKIYINSVNENDVSEIVKKEFIKKSGRLAATGAPDKAMAIFIDKNIQISQSRDGYLYFSPNCIQHMDTLIKYYKGEPCEKPKRKNVRLVVINSDKDDWDMLDKKTIKAIKAGTNLKKLR
jgi:hypothetical protein